MKVYVVFAFESNENVYNDKEEFVKIFASQESAQNFIDKNDYWLYPRIEEWEVEQ